MMDTDTAPARTHGLTSPPAPRKDTTGKAHAVAIDVEKMSFFYGPKQALFDISTRLQVNMVTAFIGPSGCGKSTFLRTLNRMNDTIPGSKVVGKVLIDGKDIYGPTVDPVSFRRAVGMVFKKS